MKTLFLTLILLSQVSLANSQVGNFGHGSKVCGGSQGGTLGNGQGTMQVAGNGAGTMGGSVGTLNSHSYIGGTGGGGILAMGSNGTDNSQVGTL